LKWTNTGLANIKGAITGTCRSCDPQHTARYLAAYEWRFNRRFDRCLLCASDRGDRSIELGRGSGGDAGGAFDVSVEVASYQQLRRIGGDTGVIKSTFAVLRLMTNSKREDCRTGKSAGFSPVPHHQET
jgi:hypothetical protein